MKRMRRFIAGCLPVLIATLVALWMLNPLLARLPYWRALALIGLLVAALKGSDERMRTKMFAAMSQRAAQSVQDEIETRGPMKVSEVQDAQKRILAIARQLGESGAIMLGGSGDDYV